MGTSGTESCEGCLWTQFKHLTSTTSTQIESGYTTFTSARKASVLSKHAGFLFTEYGNLDNEKTHICQKTCLK